MGRRSFPVRRDYTWTGNTGVAALASGGTADFGGVATNTQAATIVRIRGQLLASIDGPVDGDKVVVAAGFIAVTEEQVAVGPTAIPSPLSDLDAEWIWHGFLLMQSQGVVATQDTTQMARLMIDSKAMRKLKQSQEAHLIVHASSLSGTPATDVMMGIRVLFQE